LTVGAQTVGMCRRAVLTRNAHVVHALVPAGTVAASLAIWVTESRSALAGDHAVVAIAAPRVAVAHTYESVIGREAGDADAVFTAGRAFARALEDQAIAAHPSTLGLDIAGATVVAVTVAAAGVTYGTVRVRVGVGVGIGVGVGVGIGVGVHVGVHIGIGITVAVGALGTERRTRGIAPGVGGVVSDTRAVSIALTGTGKGIAIGPADGSVPTVDPPTAGARRTLVRGACSGAGGPGLDHAHAHDAESGLSGDGHAVAVATAESAGVYGPVPVSVRIGVDGTVYVGVAVTVPIDPASRWTTVESEGQDHRHQSR